jgi:hypothetical protein
VTEPALRAWLAQTIAQCCDGRLSAAEVLAADCTLAAMGVGSLALVRLIDLVEGELGVFVELDGDTWFRDLDSMTAYLRDQMTSEPGR